MAQPSGYIFSFPKYFLVFGEVTEHKMEQWKIVKYKGNKYIINLITSSTSHKTTFVNYLPAIFSH